MAGIESEQDYLAATKKLADEFLKEYTHEQLAHIAAQHVIYRQEIEGSNKALRETLESLRATSNIHEQLLEIERQKFNILLHDKTSIAKLAVDSYSSQRGKKGAAAAHKETNAIKLLVLAAWDKDGDKYSTRTSFANHALKTFLKGRAVKHSTIMRWLRSERPAKSIDKKAAIKKHPEAGGGLGFHPSISRKKR
jgi:hypothetical protein